VPTRSPTQAATTATPTDNNSIGHTSGFGPIITSGGSLVSPWEMLDADLPHGQLWLPRACCSFTSRTFGALSVCSNAALPSPRVRV